MKKILVTGGCGYIGSHTVIDLIDNGFEVVSVDNNSNSSLRAIEQIREVTGVQVKNYTVDLTDLEKTKRIFSNENIDGIIHFAALKFVGESVEKPLLYFQNNLNSLMNIMHCMSEFNVPNLIFSSSCSVYGNADELPVTESTIFKDAESPYARTKQMGEHMITDFAKAEKGIQAILLRYFNPAGAHESGLIGESPINKASNLIPVITETAIGNRDKVTVFGDTYETRDGSCVRDYIHVMDLANAHTKALQRLLDKKQEVPVDVFNLGIGNGVTVLEAIKSFEKVSGEKLNYTIGDRRAGDVVAIYSDMEKATNVLKWKPNRTIDEIMQTAWKWEQARSEVPAL